MTFGGSTLDTWQCNGTNVVGTLCHFSFKRVLQRKLLQPKLHLEDPANDDAFDITKTVYTSQIEIRVRATSCSLVFCLRRP